MLLELFYCTTFNFLIAMYKLPLCFFLFGKDIDLFLVVTDDILHLFFKSVEISKNIKYKILTNVKRDKGFRFQSK